MPNVLKFFLKAAGTVGLFYILSFFVDVPHAWELLTQVNVWWVAVAVGIAMSSTMLSGWRWKAVATSLGLPADIAYQRLIWLGAFMSQILPSAVGGDAVRTVALKDYWGQGVLRSVLFERGIGLLVNVMLTLSLLPFAYMLLGASPLFFVLVAIGLCGVGGALGYIFFGDKLPLELLPKLGRWLKNMVKPLRDVLFHNGSFTIWKLSFLIQILGVFQMYALSLALGFTLPFYGVLVLFPPLVLLMIVPFSLGGWGLREGAVVGMFVTAGLLNPTQAATLSVLYGLSMVVAALPGGLTLLLKKKDA